MKRIIGDKNNLRFVIFLNININKSNYTKIYIAKLETVQML